MESAESELAAKRSSYHREILREREACLYICVWKRKLPAAYTLKTENFEHDIFTDCNEHRQVTPFKVDFELAVPLFYAIPGLI